MNDLGRELGWDDVIEKDGSDFVLLPEGDYDFEVINFERGRHNGSDKLPPCTKATINIQVKGNEGISIIKHNLFLHTITEGMLSAFFVGIGQKKHGEPVKMDWNKVPGSTGRCKLGIKKWTNDQGEEKVFNEIKKFYEPTSQQTVFKPGTF